MTKYSGDILCGTNIRQLFPMWERFLETVSFSFFAYTTKLYTKSYHVQDSNSKVGKDDIATAE